MPSRTPFQGDFFVGVDPRAEALGCSRFALRAIGIRTRECPNSRSPSGGKSAACSLNIHGQLPDLGSSGYQNTSTLCINIFDHDAARLRSGTPNHTLSFATLRRYCP